MKSIVLAICIVCGTCASSQACDYNWGLIKTPVDVVRSVVVHKPVRTMVCNIVERQPVRKVVRFVAPVKRVANLGRAVVRGVNVVLF